MPESFHFNREKSASAEIEGTFMRMETDSPKIVPVTRAEKTSWGMNEVLKPAYMVTMVAQVDATEMEQLRKHSKQNGHLPPSFTSLVVKAASTTMMKNPQANRAILGFPFFRKLYQFQNANISVAVEKNLPSMPGQAYAAPIYNTYYKSLDEITVELKELAVCDESNDNEFKTFMRILKYVPRPFSLWLINAPYWFPSLWAKHRGSACWVNAPSKAGAELVFTTWPWPITFSFGVVKKRPVVIADQVQVRLTMPVVMVFDRRIMGGGPAGRIFAEFCEILEKGQAGGEPKY